METQDLSVAKIIGWMIVSFVTTAFILWFGKRQRDRKRSRVMDSFTTVHEKITNKLHEHVEGLREAKEINNQISYGWMIISQQMNDGKFIYQALYAFHLPHIDGSVNVRYITEDGGKRIKNFETLNDAVLGLTTYADKIRANSIYSLRIADSSESSPNLIKFNSPWLISVLAISQAMLSFFELAKPFLIGAGVILFIGGIWALINLAINKAVEIDEDDINWPDEDNF